MRIIKDKTGRYPRRLWFEDGELEGVAERHRQGSLSRIGRSGDLALQVDKFIELYLPAVLKKEIVLDPYADLIRTEGPGVLGATYFYEDHLEVKIHRDLTEEAERTGQWGRYNSTATHEGGHCILHPVIFEDDPNQQSLFKSERARKISCLQRTIEGEYTGEWWEFQANKVMANLLMPRDLFLQHFIRERNAYSIVDNVGLVRNSHLFDAVVGYLARTFEASKQAVRIRLKELSQVPDWQQERFFKDAGFVRIRDG